MSITVLIRTYQRPFVLKRAIDSVLSQTYSNFEIIVVEDGNTPSAEALIKEYQNTSPIIYECLYEHKGRSFAANRAMELASGKVKRRFCLYQGKASRLLLCYNNYLPIQSVMFRKELIERHGKIDEEIPLN